MTLDEAIDALRAAWPEHGCGAGDCCLRRPGGQVLGTCRCIRDWKDRPGVQPVYRLLDAARRVVEAPHGLPPSLDEALAVLVDRASTQAESGTGEVARPLREAGMLTVVDEARTGGR